MLGRKINIALTGLVVVAGMTLALDSPDAHAQNDGQTSAATASQVCDPGETQPMFRLFNRMTGEHLFTADTHERDVLSRSIWMQEGVSWVTPTNSRTPVFRLFHPIIGDHHYTTDTNEVRVLTTQDVWRNEGVAWYSDDCKTVKVYRQFSNRLLIGSHNYTTDLHEYTVNNERNGWQGEGIAWYASEPGWALGADPIYVSMKVTVSDVDGSDSDTFTIPKTTGLQYQVDGKNIAAGTYKIADYFTYTNHKATVVVTAKAVGNGYRIKGGAAGSIYTQDVDDLIKATPAPVTFSDNNGSNNDTFTVPNTTGVQYTVNNSNIAAGTYKVKDYFAYADYWANPQIKAIAKDGYSLVGTTSWTQTIDGRTEVVPQKVTFADNNGQDSDTFTIPNVTGVQYVAGNKNVAAGTYTVKDYFTYTNYMANATVTASPKAGYKFPSNATTSWQKTFDGYTYVDTANPTGNDASGKRSDTYTIPNVTGVQYKANGANVAAGTHTVTTHNASGNATVNITAAPKSGFKLNNGNQTSWSFNYTATVIPEAVIFSDPYGTGSDTYTIPEVEGVYYTVDGVRTAPGTYNPTNYTNHFRNISIHAYVESGYKLRAGSTVYYLHTFTDGINATPTVTSTSTSDFGPYTKEQAQVRIEAYANQLSGQINNSSTYAPYTTFGQIYGSDSIISSRTYGDAEKEINRRFAKRFEMRTAELRATVGLNPIPLMRLSESDEAEMYAHAIYTQDMQVNGVGHYTDDSHLVGVFNRTKGSGQGFGFDGTTYLGPAENLAFNTSGPDTTPEEMADKMILQYIEEYEYLVNGNGVTGHLTTLLRDKTLSFSAFYFCAEKRFYFPDMPEWGSYYWNITAENYSWR